MKNNPNLPEVFDGNEKISQSEYKTLEKLASEWEKLLKNLKTEDLKKLKVTLEKQLNNYSSRKDVSSKIKRMDKNTY